VTDDQGAKGELVSLCHVDELPASGARGFDLRGSDRDSLFVMRRENGLRAYFNICPHAGAALPWQKDKYFSADGKRIVCHAHGAEFDPDSGECLRGPAMGRSLYPVELSVTADGIIQARLSKRAAGEDK